MQTHPHRLRQLSQDTQTSTDVLKNIASLMTNIYDGVGGGEGKKTALQSGVLDLTVKLLQGRDPIPVRGDVPYCGKFLRSPILTVFIDN